MSNAKAILAERLAKGEITEADYDRLTSKLGDPQPRGMVIEESNSAEERGRQIGERVGTTLLLFFPMTLVFAYRWISGDDRTNLTQAFGSFGWIFYLFGALFMAGIFKLLFYDFRR